MYETHLQIVGVFFLTFYIFSIIIEKIVGNYIYPLKRRSIMKCNITCIPGDGIGPEIVAEAKKVLEKVAKVY